jgi:hypothetical protein
MAWAWEATVKFLNIPNGDLERLDDKLGELTYLLERPDTPKFQSQRLLAYLTAGGSIVKAPVYEYDLWARLLVQPLSEILSEAPSTNVGRIAREVRALVTETMAKQGSQGW